MAEQKPLTDEKLLEVFATLDGRSQQDAALMRMDAEGAPVDTVELLGARHGWRAFLRAARGVEAAHGIGVEACEQGQPFEFHWLVELRPAFEGHPHFGATYYAGWSESRGDAVKTINPMEAARFARKEDAERVAANLLNTLSCVWQAVEHGFAQGVEGTPSAAPGAWTCSRCGFRGFWSGGPHECASGVPGTQGDKA